MKKNFQISILALSILFLGLTYTSCKRHYVEGISEPAVCEILQDGELDSIGRYLDDYLSTLPLDQPDKNVGKLAIWLEDFDCIAESRIMGCLWCIETYPPMTEIEIAIRKDGNTHEKVMDIQKTEPIRFVGFH